MAGLADDWPENRQTCVDVLCGYLRMPYEPDKGEEIPEPERLALRASREGEKGFSMKENSESSTPCRASASSV